MKPLRIGTRGSALARQQARMVASAIEQSTGRGCDLVIVTTAGDRLPDAPLSAAGGKRLFVKEIEDALARGDIDVAVHSAKDLPVELPDGLTLGGALPREDPRDALVIAVPAGPFTGLDEAVASLGDEPRLGTSSVRRAAQLARILPHARFEPMRGNLDTRLRKLDQGQADALVLAVAGLRRLGLANRISAVLPVAACVPAPGQGLIAVEVRQDDEAAVLAARLVDDPTASAALAAERALVGALGGGCQLPLGAVAYPRDPGSLDLHAIAVSLDGRRAARARGTGLLDDPASLGRTVAARLVEAGALAILDEVRRAQGGGPAS